MKNQISSQHSQNVRPSNFSQLDASTSEDIRRTQQFRCCQFWLNLIFIKITTQNIQAVQYKNAAAQILKSWIFFTAYTVNVNTVFFHLECGLFGNNQPVNHFFMLFLKNQNFILYFRIKHKYRFIFAISFSCLSQHPYGTTSQSLSISFLCFFSKMRECFHNFGKIT